ncbi:hypothetical protein MYAER_2112 [Microcystis aeruginosa NIES-2549]|uniref:Uncharacterized protein n=1 Tax=Microcystis aeruginosa NIES-2549 TaxID=1641812 RepID=A0A0F6RL82_MICAE|nr:hypothetical protein MYAER_2112 [Microcystis aeruginosa NIES-2549]AOC52858.1 hypothetical protein amyaer_2139 [Microcystis aeruginosa NIES-2481]
MFRHFHRINIEYWLGSFFQNFIVLLTDAHKAIALSILIE